MSREYYDDTQQMTKRSIPEAFPNNTRTIPEGKTRVKHIHNYTYIIPKVRF